MRRDWQAIPWRVAGQARTDYRRSILGPAGCELRLAAEEWPSRAGWWAARAEIVRDSTARAYLPLWAQGYRMAGYPTPEAAIVAAEDWLAEWRAGWMGDMHCAGDDLVADLDICTESLDGAFIGPFCGTLDMRDPWLSAAVMHYPHGALWADCAAGDAALLAEIPEGGPLVVREV